MEAIKHHGILGMRWGIRRERGPEGRVRGPGKPTEDYLRMKELRAKGSQSLTNVELKAAIERMNLEKQYKDLTSKDVSKGRAVGKKVLVRIGDKALDRVIDKSLNAAFDAAFRIVKR